MTRRGCFAVRGLRVKSAGLRPQYHCDPGDDDDDSGNDDDDDGDDVTFQVPLFQLRSGLNASPD